MIRYFATSGDRRGWAIDEDLRLLRESLAGVAREASLHSAQVVHCPFWAGLALHHPGVLARRFVIAHADNPPFFYLTQPGFARVQQAVDLWVARSTEAGEQFDALRLPSVVIPYAIDPALFFPIRERAQIRSALGIPPGSYVIGNFHRDSEGAELTKPKAQKCPELMVEVCRGLREAGAPVHVLLAGPRRHWIRAALTRAGVPFTFVGNPSIPGDDFGPNILPRTRLNELTNACDLYFIPSRWEGGPQSAMEAAACKIKILSPPFGVARDILEPESLFACAPGAREKILADIRSGFLEKTVEPQFARWQASHTSAAMAAGLRDLYLSLENNPRLTGKKQSPTDRLLELAWMVRSRLPRHPAPARVEIFHETGGDPDLEEILRTLPPPAATPGKRLRVAGFLTEPARWQGKVEAQMAGCGFRPADAVPGVPVIFPSAQDAVNFRSAGGANPVLVCALAREPEPGAGPLVVGPDDLQASGRIARALAAGRPVVHPAHLAYFYQVFHAGVTYRDEPGTAVRTASAHADELASYSLPPGDGRTFFASLAGELGK